MKMLKQGTARDSFHGKGQNKVRLGNNFIENAEVRYGCGFILLKILK